MQSGQGAPGGPGLNGPRLREAVVRPGKVRHGVWASWGLAQPGPGPRPAARPAALPWLLSLGSGPGPEACGERRGRDQSSLARGRGTVPTPEAFSLEQRGAPRRQVPADPQQAGSRPPVRPVVARHASRLRRAGGLSAVSCPRVPPRPHSPAHCRRLSPGLARPLPHQPLGGDLPWSFCSILGAPAPPQAPNSCSCAHPAPSTLPSPGALAWLFPPKALLSWPPRTHAARGLGTSARKRQMRTTRAEADGRPLPLGPCPMRSQQAGPGRRGWTDGGVQLCLRKDPRRQPDASCPAATGAQTTRPRHCPPGRGQKGSS